MDSFMDTSDINPNNLEEIIQSPAFECIKPRLIAFIEKELKADLQIGGTLTTEYTAENEDDSSYSVHDETYGDTLYAKQDAPTYCNSPLEKYPVDHGAQSLIPDFGKIEVSCKISPEPRTKRENSRENKKMSETRRPPRDPEHAEKCKISRAKYKSKVKNLEQREKDLKLINENLKIEIKNMRERIEKRENLRKNNLKIAVDPLHYFYDTDVQMSSSDCPNYFTNI